MFIYMETMKKFRWTLITALGKQCSKTNTAFFKKCNKIYFKSTGRIMRKEYFTRFYRGFSWIWRNAHIYGGNNVFDHFERSFLLTLNSPEVGSGAEWWLSWLSLSRITVWSTLLNGWVKDSVRYCHEVHDPRRKFLNRNEP